MTWLEYIVSQVRIIYNTNNSIETEFCSYRKEETQMKTTTTQNKDVLYRQLFQIKPFHM